ncbi:hypothetical protein [Alteriqipengyuania lutimaris]|uniref:Uncharacterized protein n=1 Tax=Alteriqipengyuania lutimaris TaxID=1538146 RepID=A0A395LI65_9SPHN|nr:hypothetical protein [Alteriqipengyuania lutimaris]MBB3035374.1 hypothetical protein [Alteriqipengyuania lutimaris]RDS75957.1 hypothetical protein DL238_14900 [Alteriqipengyuania lutimaris]
MAVMMLPAKPAPVNTSWTLQDFGSILPGANGGPAQRVNRLGNRFRLSVEMPPMTESDATAWQAALMRAVRVGAAFRFRQPGGSGMSPGSPVVDGAGQVGAQLAISGATPGFVARAGRLFSLQSGGQRYLHMVAETVRDPGNMPIEPLLRVVPEDGDVLEFAAPVIEGLLETPPEWRLDVDYFTRGFSFTIAEAR